MGHLHLVLPAWVNIFQKILILQGFLENLILLKRKMDDFRENLQTFRKRCQMLKQMRKKANLLEKGIILGAFVLGVSSKEVT